MAPSRWLWVAETVWLTVLGGALGLLMCQWLIGTIITLAPEGIPRMDEVAIDWPVAGFSILTMAIATLLCAAAPIRHASVANLIESLNDGSRTVAGGRSYRTRSSLLVVQIGLAVVLLVAAGLVVQSFNALQRLDLGFTREAVMRIKVEPRSTPLPVNEWIGELLSRVRQLPEVDGRGRGLPHADGAGLDRPGHVGDRRGTAGDVRNRQQQPDRELSERDARLLQGDGHSAAARAHVLGGGSRRPRRGWR